MTDGQEENSAILASYCQTVGGKEGGERNIDHVQLVSGNTIQIAIR